MEYIPVKLNRLWQGHIASIRDYIVGRAVATNTPLKITVKGRKDYMILSPEDIKSKKFQISTQEFQSKLNPGQTYTLIDFTWKPHEQF